MRITPNVRARLVDEAANNFRSITQEAEFRLEQSFLKDTYADQAADLAYGQRAAGILKLLARVMIDAGPAAAFMNTGKPEDAVNWTSNAYAFHEVVKGIAAALEGLRPEGDRSPSDPAKHLPVGEMMARGALIAIKDRECGGELGDWARPVRERLSDIVNRIRVDVNAPIMVNVLPPQVVEGGKQVESRILDTHIGRSVGRRAEGDDR
jgi:hypothetical protein